MTRHKAGQQVGPWTLLRLLGSGGNAEVWAAKDVAREVALKIPHVRNPASEQYQRFRAEIDVLQRLEATPGILPLVAARTPDPPSRTDPPWIAMPIAMSIRDALGDSPELEAVVDAVASVASTLEELEGLGIWHRDIKPDNLYQYEAEWVIGDFGLAEFPEKDTLTEAGKKLGAAYFLAPEMLAHPESAEPGPADVYALSKTLWVLATGQQYPPPGEHRLDLAPILVAAYRDHSRVALLDRFLERATRHDPARRPTMAEMTSELRAWGDKGETSAPTGDLSDLAAQIQGITAPGFARDEEVQRHVAEGRNALLWVAESLRPLEEKLRTELADAATVSAGSNSTVLDTLMPTVDMSTALWQEGYCIVVASPGRSPVYLWSGMGFRVLDDGNLDVAAAHLVGGPGIVRSRPWADSGSATVGSAEQGPVLRRLVDGLQTNAAEALSAFLEELKET